jgi:hypothetical protein
MKVVKYSQEIKSKGKIMRAYSQDLRDRVIKAYEGNIMCPEI